MFFCFISVFILSFYLGIFPTTYFSQYIFFYTEDKRHLFSHCCLETYHFLNVLITQQEGIAVFLL
jgi:hypothetical protein